MENKLLQDSGDKKAEKREREAEKRSRTQKIRG